MASIYVNRICKKNWQEQWEVYKIEKRSIEFSSSDSSAIEVIFNLKVEVAINSNDLTADSIKFYHKAEISGFIQNRFICCHSIALNSLNLHPIDSINLLGEELSDIYIFQAFGSKDIQNQFRPGNVFVSKEIGIVGFIDYSGMTWVLAEG